MRYLHRRPWLPVIAWATLILVGTSVPGPSLPAGPRGSDKLAHALLYAVLGALVTRALRQAPRGREHAWRTPAFIILKTFIFCGAFGAFDEWHQQFFQRSTSAADWVADLVGILVGAGLAVILGGRFGERDTS